MTALNNAARPGLLVDFDALFDTRLATLEEIDPLLAVNALKKGYLLREEDSFEHCPHELFKQVYECRNNDTLGRAIITNIKDIVIDFAKDAIQTLKTYKTNNSPNIYINVYPYKIAKDVAGDILKPFYDALDGRANIHLVNVPPNELTVPVVKKNLSYVIKYDFMSWLLSLGQQGEIQRNPLNEVTLVAPRIYQDGKPKDMEEFRNKLEPYQCAEVFFAQYIKLELYPSQLFSAKIEQSFIDELVDRVNKTDTA